MGFKRTPYAIEQFFSGKCFHGIGPTLAKKIVDENQARKAREDFGFEEVHEATYSRENPIEHALMVKASEADDNRLVG